MARKAAAQSAEVPLQELLGSLTESQLREVVASAADVHEDVQRMVRLLAARAGGDLTQLRVEVDRGLRTRRFLDYRQSNLWAGQARPIIAELARFAEEAPSAELVELIQRAIAHVVKVIHHADDSSGLIGDLVRDLLDLHARACDAGVADPVKLARWMIKFRFSDQDFFEADPVRYGAALGQPGLAAYRTAVDRADDVDAFAVRYSRERLAVLDRDLNMIVELLGRDLSNPHQFFRVAEAMAEIDRDDLVLHWTARGIAESDGFQLERLYDLKCRTHERMGDPVEVLAVRRSHHGRTPSSSTYRALRTAADVLHAWERERDAARATLAARDVRGFIDALLGDGENQLAWQAASSVPAVDLDARLWLRLAESREGDAPSDAVVVYERVADEVLVDTDRRAYAQAVRILARAKLAAGAADELDSFNEHMTALRETHRRRPTLIAMLDKAGLVGR